MNNKAEQWYQTMLTDLLYCQQKGLSQQEEIDCCFQISNKYWAILKNEVSNYEFETATDEVHFFKKIKPLFIAQIEYYGYLQHAQLYKESANDTKTLEEFWKRELNRLKKFIKKYEAFYDYYKNEETENDEYWFVRANSDLSNFSAASSYDLDANANTSHDHLISKIIALEKYSDYVKKELEEMKTD